MLGKLYVDKMKETSHLKNKIMSIIINIHIVNNVIRSL